MNYRNLLAWVIGILILIFLQLIVEKIFSLLGVPFIINFDKPIEVIVGSGRYSYSEISDSTMSTEALAFSFANLMLCVRIGLAISTKKFDGELDFESNVYFWVTFTGLFFFGFIVLIIKFLLLIFQLELLTSYIELALALATFIICKNIAEDITEDGYK